MKLSATLQTVRNAICPAVLAAAAVSCLASCSGEPTPDVPMERSRVLLRLFSSAIRSLMENSSMSGSVFWDIKRRADSYSSIALSKDLLSARAAAVTL